MGERHIGSAAVTIAIFYHTFKRIATIFTANSFKSRQVTDIFRIFTGQLLNFKRKMLTFNEKRFII